MVWIRRSGPELNAALMRFMPEMSVTSPGMSTHRSRGIDSTVTVLAAGSMRTAMVTSLRWPPSSVLGAERVFLGGIVDEGP